MPKRKDGAIFWEENPGRTKRKPKDKWKSRKKNLMRPFAHSVVIQCDRRRGNLGAAPHSPAACALCAKRRTSVDKTPLPSLPPPPPLLPFYACCRRPFSVVVLLDDILLLFFFLPVSSPKPLPRFQRPGAISESERSHE